MLNAEPAPAALDTLAEEYEILRELGRGGTAVVYLARERATGEEVAIKLVRSRFADDDEARARLAREARFVTQLDHPNVVPVRDVLDLGDNGVALVMSHVSGRTLREILRDEGPLAPARTANVLRDVASALGAAHGMGIVHRDVKPENVFITDDERAVLADFGIARSMSAEAQQLTMHGVAIGTPAYMAPEQIDGEDLDARADIYSLGLLGWEMLTGKRPFAGEALYSVLYHQKHVQLDDPRARLDGVPPTLVSALAGAVEKQRDARWTGADAFLSALDGREALREWPVSEPAASATVRVERAARPEPESVVAIDWREVMEPGPVPAPAWRSFSRRQLALGGGIGALAALALVVSAVRIHSRAPVDDAQFRVSNGVIAVNDAPRSVALPASTAQAPASVADSMRVAASPATESSRSPVPAPASPPAPTASAAVPTAVASPIAAPPVAPSPAPAPTGSRVRVSVGGRHSCLLAEDGRTFCWGGNDRGQLGTDNISRLTAPLSPVTGGRFTALASGMSHSCALTANGDAYCWGDNDAGQLGDGTTAARESPVRVAGRHDFSSIVAGSAHACALATNGTAWCWGSDATGQLGDARSGRQSVPVAVAGDHRFTALAAGWGFTCALNTDGDAWCWGSDASGELGDSATASERVPVRVRGSHHFTAIAAGSAHACAIAADGSAWCWGSNSSGQLGDGTTNARLTPVRVKSSERFTHVAAGAVHSCALSANGDGWCWGSNVYGQLGNDGNTDSAIPVRVAGSHSFASIRAFGSHDCAVTTAGETFCWGYNLDGQLGDGTRSHRSRPVYVQRPGAS
ncbi:MAG TPA: protein kinase [Gemmatimonadaceae bacterium]|nr:protein kinase [Gemmatimonadaceae bacterium]